jgi:hypothetical protein
MREKSSTQIIWGGNYYPLPPSNVLVGLGQTGRTTELLPTF